MWRAEALTERDWELTAWRCFFQPWFKAPEHPDDFNKLKLEARAAQRDELQHLAEEHQRSLPETCTNEEALARFNAFCLRTGQ